MELVDTVDLMTSSDYNDRFKAEYYQLKIRIEKLSSMIDKYEKNELDFVPTCTLFILKTQVKHMKEYMTILKTRAMVENIEL